MGQAAFTDEKLKKALKQATKAVESKTIEGSTKKEYRAYEKKEFKAFTKTLRNVRKIFHKLEKTDGANAYYRIAEAYIEMTEDDTMSTKACMVKQYMAFAKMYYQDAYHECEGDIRSHAKTSLMEYFDLHELTEEDGSKFLFYFDSDAFEFRGTTYYWIDPLEHKDGMGCSKFIACTKDENGKTTYRRVTSYAEQEDVRKAYFSR